MTALYSEKATFQDPAFGVLSAEEVRAMWTMLLKSGGSDLDITFEIVHENENSGEAIWHAKYLFGKDKRTVHNIINAKFRFEGGKIIQHVDQFDFWRWSRMALGFTGLLLGWTPFLKNKVRIQAKSRLKKYMIMDNSSYLIR